MEGGREGGVGREYIITSQPFRGGATGGQIFDFHSSK